jgi:hypothetical protein
MNKWLLLVVISFSIISCSKRTEEKIIEEVTCDINVGDPQLQAYNDVLIELVEDHFYLMYLGEEGELIGREYSNHLEADSQQAVNKLKASVNALKHNLLRDTASLKTIFISHKGTHQVLFNEFSEALWQKPLDGLEGNDGIRHLLARYNADSPSIFIELGEPQQKYRASDFQACTFKVDSLGEAEFIYDLEPHKKRKAIGQVGLSKIIWNEQQNKGVLCYEFSCFGNCGKGGFLEIEKLNGRWKIIDTIPFWIS